MYNFIFTIPRTVETIGKDAFSGCRSLTTWTFGGYNEAAIVLVTVCLNRAGLFLIRAIGTIGENAFMDSLLSTMTFHGYEIVSLLQWWLEIVLCS